MRDFRRSQVGTLIERLSEPPWLLLAVFSPRQTGKTTAVRQALASIERRSQYVAVDEATPVGTALSSSMSGTDAVPSLPVTRDKTWLVEVWEDSRRRAWSAEGGFVLVLDEIQTIDGWSDVVKGLWDADRASGCPLQVVVLGSAPLLMQAGLNESLAGRFEPIRFTHWSYLEMAEAFDLNLDRYIYFGGYPGTASFVRDQQRWMAYVRGALVEPIIERDVLAMARVDKPSLLKRLFDMGCLYSGQALSYNKMLGQLQDAGNTTTLTRYLKLLSDAGLLAGLPKQTNRPVSAKASTPKLNVFNTALMSAAWGYSFEEARADRTFWGRLVESAVGAHLLNTAGPATSVKYWRSGDHEVDFVLQRGPKVVGIEVKTGMRPLRLSGLGEFVRRFQPVRTLVVGTGGEPLHEFLSVPADHWFEAPSEPAIDLARSRPELSQKLLRNAHQALDRPSASEDLTTESMRERLRGHTSPTRELNEVHRQRQAALGSSAEEDWRRETERLLETHRTRRRQQQEEWFSLLRSGEAELLNNTFPAANLHTLALAFFGRFQGSDDAPPYERVRDFIGGDRRLADAVMTALRDALWRDDLPSVAETMSLHAQSQMPYLAYPVQASMHLRADGPEPSSPLDDSRKQQALTLYYCFPLGREETQRCRDRWFRKNPDLVLEVLHRCAVAALRTGDESLPVVGELDRLRGRDDLVSDARLRLLDAFPTRITKHQIPHFDYLLGKVLDSSDSAALGVIAERKLALKSLNVAQRVRWMTVAAMLAGEKQTGRLRDYVSGNERRLRHLAEFLHQSRCIDRDEMPARRSNAELLDDLVRVLGPSYRRRVLADRSR